MIKKGLIFGLIAVLSAGLLFVGCDNGTSSDSAQISIGGRLVDTVVSTDAGLYLALYNDNYQVIGVEDSTPITLASVTEIPEDKTVILFSQVSPKATDGLEVKGTLIVEGAGVLSASVSSSQRVRVTSGRIEVNNGTISVDSVVAIHGSTIEVQILGTSQVHFNGGTLAITGSVAKLEDVKTAFGWVPKGTVQIGGLTEKVTPTELVAAIPVTAVRRLAIGSPVNSPEPDAAEELTIPEGLRFATNDTLPNLTTLTVEGGLNALEASLAKVTKLTVTGRLVAPKATYNGLTELTVEGNDTGDDDDPGFVVTTPLTALQSLTVNADGIFTSASPVGIGAASTSTEGFTLTINKGGKADIASITKLKAATVAGTLTTLGFTKNDSAGTASPLAIAEGGTINGIKLPSVTTVSAITSADSITIEDFTIAATQTFKIPGTVSAPAKTLTIAAGKTFTYDGVVTIEAGGSLVLATATGSVAKIAGTGKIDAGATTIIGGWEAVGTGDGTLTISSEAGGIGAKITGAALATGLKASAASANITQRAGIENNALAIAVTTQLDLNGASITLMSAIAANNPASLSLAAATTAVIITGTDTAAVALADAGGLFVKTTAVNGKVLCSAIDSTTGLVINKGTTTATKLAKITGGSAAQTIKATALNVDGAGIPITIDKDSPVS